MFRSIRWRLVVSYVLVTLLTVSLVGVLTLSLMERYVEQRVVEDLTANAESVARQAAPLMWPMNRAPALKELARTAAFLGGVRVRILDDRQRVLADSGSSTGVDRVMWLTPPEELEMELPDYAWMMVMPHVKPSQVPSLQGSSLLEQLPYELEWTIVNRITGAWGNRFVFEGLFDGKGVPTSLSDADSRSTREALGEAAAPRSEQVITAYIGEAQDPLGYVELSSGPNFGAEALATTRRAFLFAAGGAMIMAVVVGLLMSQGLTAPLRSLTAAARRMSDDLSTRASVRGRDEIGQLARQLNQMAERLEASFAALTADRDALRRFIADASHELRTPITALKNFSELLQGAAADDPAARDEFLAESAAQVERLEWITSNLLNLSRLDAGLIALARDSHDVGEMLEGAVGVFIAPAQEKEISLVITPPASPVTLYCDRARVELALSNLLDNALKFTPHGGRVEIGADQTDEGVRLWVQDDGPGIHPADQPRVFERFYRGRGSRAEGSGLGLAIVKSVVEAHGGRVWVETEVGVGSRFVMVLPLPTSSHPQSTGGAASHQ